MGTISDGIEIVATLAHARSARLRLDSDQTRLTPGVALQRPAT